MTIKKKDFIEINYTGKIKGTSKIFDTTDLEIAKKNELYNPKAKYESIIVCVGENNVVPGLDEFFIGKKPGKYNLDLSADKAFGIKNPKLIRILNASIFKKQEIKPFPGLQVNVDNSIGIVRSVTSGRVIVDFNHPLAGRQIEYELEIKRILTDDNEKAQSLFKLYFNKEVNIKDGVASIELDLPNEFQKELEKKVKELIPSIKKIDFIKKEATPKK